MQSPHHVAVAAFVLCASLLDAATTYMCLMPCCASIQSPLNAWCDPQAHEAVIKLRDNLRSEQHIVLEFAITIFRDVFKPAQVRFAKGGGLLGVAASAT